MPQYKQESYNKTVLHGLLLYLYFIFLAKRNDKRCSCFFSAPNYHSLDYFAMTTCKCYEKL